VFNPRILVVEDNPDDMLILEHALRKAGIGPPMHVCRDGLDAIDYLDGKGIFKDRKAFPFPRLMITDIKMPRCSGFELLEWLRAHPSRPVVPIVILSTSDQEIDVARAYRLGANSYFKKPGDVGHLVAILKQIISYWSYASLPELPEGGD
jgi:CheY-like chemotaxis protein